MKKILSLLVIFSLITYLGFKIRDYYRYRVGAEYDYKMNSEIDTQYHDPEILQKYYALCHDIGVFARAKWYNESVDVKYPNESDSSSLLAAKTYSQMIISARIYEGQLKNSLTFKKNGFSNQDVLEAEKKGLNPIGYQCHRLLSEGQVKLNDANESIWWVQKMLNKKGASIKEDGIFNTETQTAVINFQTQKNIYISKTIDLQTIKNLTE